MLSLQQQQLHLATKPVEQEQSRPSLDRQVAVRERNPQDHGHQQQQQRQHPEAGREIGLIAFLFQVMISLTFCILLVYYDINLVRLSLLEWRYFLDVIIVKINVTNELMYK